MPHEQLVPSVLVVSLMEQLAAPRLWAPIRAKQFGAARDVLRELERIRARDPEYRPDLLIAELSALEPSYYVGVEVLRQFLCALTRIVRPKAMLVIGDSQEGNRRKTDWQMISREFGVHIRPWGDSIGRLQEMHDLPRGFLGLVFDAPEFEQQAPCEPKHQRGEGKQASLSLFVSTDAEAGCHRWRVDAHWLVQLAWVFSRIDTSGENGKVCQDRHGRDWARRALQLGRDLRERLLPPNRPRCLKCAVDGSKPCVMEVVLRGEHGAKLGPPEMPLVVVAFDGMGPPLPIEFLPWPGADGVERFLFEVKPVMHQLLQHGPPCGHVERPEFRETNFLLISTNSDRLDGSACPEADGEVEHLAWLLNREIQREDGHGKAIVYRSRDFENFDEFQRKLEVDSGCDDKHRTRWDVLHWAGHAHDWNESRKATFSWSARSGDEPLKHDRVGAFIQNLNRTGNAPPSLVHFSCCSVAATESPAGFVRLGVPYVLAHRWEVRDDYQAVEFVHEFYRNWLFYGQHPSVALWETRKRHLDRPIAASAVLVGGTDWETWQGFCAPSVRPASP